MMGETFEKTTHSIEKLIPETSAMKTDKKFAMARLMGRKFYPDLETVRTYENWGLRTQMGAK